MNKWLPSTHMKVKLISDVQLSPDNRAALFVATEPLIDDEHNSYLSKIYKSDMDGVFESSATFPRWSPDGKWISFLSSSSDTPQLHLKPSEEGETTILTSGKNAVQAYRWAPNSKQIAFVRADEREAEKTKDTSYVYKQDKSINRLYLIDILAAAAKPLTSDAYFVRGAGDFGGAFEEFDFSPDGKKLVFSFAPASGLDHHHLDGSLALLDLATGQITEWEKHVPLEALPRFSPDGKLVAFLCSSDMNTYTYDRYVGIRTADGKNFRQLAPTYNEGPFLKGPSLLGWTADGSHLLFFEPKGTKFHLTLLPIDGSQALEIDTGTTYFSYPVLSQDKSMLGLVVESPSTPPEAYVTPLAFQPVQISHLNQSLPSVSTTERISWPSSDGQIIEGLLTYPRDFQSGKKYPLLLVIHGGPMGFFSESYIGSPSPYPIASFADANFFVFRPNPRGSCGYGKAFRSANVQDWGGKDFEDIMSGVDFLDHQGLIDPERMGVMGWSYGGYMTAWTIGQTSRFKAASMGAGLSNLISMSGTTDLHRFLSQYMGDFWHNPILYQERSPIYHVNRVTTPCLIQHGIDDKRVPVTQAYEFYHALEREGKKPHLILYPDTDHYYKKPCLELSGMQSNFNWFKKFLLFCDADSPLKER